LEVEGTRASSSLDPQGNYDYHSSNTIDGELETAWNEGASGSGSGEWIRFDFAQPVRLARMEVANGYQSDRATYSKNARLHMIRIDYSDGSTQSVELADTMGFQEVELAPIEAEWVRLTIGSTFEGEKWPDAALSEVRFWGTAGGGTKTTGGA